MVPLCSVKLLRFALTLYCYTSLFSLTRRTMSFFGIQFGTTEPDNERIVDGIPHRPETPAISQNESASTASFRIVTEVDGEREMSQVEVNKLVQDALRRARKATSSPMPPSPLSMHSPTSYRSARERGSYPSPREGGSNRIAQILQPLETSDSDPSETDMDKLLSPTMDFLIGTMGTIDSIQTSHSMTSVDSSDSVLRKVEAEIKAARQAANDTTRKLQYVSTKSYDRIPEISMSPTAELMGILDDHLADDEDLQNSLDTGDESDIERTPTTKVSLDNVFGAQKEVNADFAKGTPTQVILPRQAAAVSPQQGPRLRLGYHPEPVDGDLAEFFDAKAEELDEEYEEGLEISLEESRSTMEEEIEPQRRQAEKTALVSKLECEEKKLEENQAPGEEGAEPSFPTQSKAQVEHPEEEGIEALGVLFQNQSIEEYPAGDNDEIIDPASEKQIKDEAGTDEKPETDRVDPKETGAHVETVAEKEDKVEVANSAPSEYPEEEGIEAVGALFQRQSIEDYLADDKDEIIDPASEKQIKDEAGTDEKPETDRVDPKETGAHVETVAEKEDKVEVANSAPSEYPEEEGIEAVGALFQRQSIEDYLADDKDEIIDPASEEDYLADDKDGIIDPASEKQIKDEIGTDAKPETDRADPKETGARVETVAEKEDKVEIANSIPSKPVDATSEEEYPADDKDGIIDPASEKQIKDETGTDAKPETDQADPKETGARVETVAEKEDKVEIANSIPSKPVDATSEEEYPADDKDEIINPASEKQIKDETDTDAKPETDQADPKGADVRVETVAEKEDKVEIANSIPSKPVDATSEERKPETPKPSTVKDNVTINQPDSMAAVSDNDVPRIGIEVDMGDGGSDFIEEVIEDDESVYTEVTVTDEEEDLETPQEEEDLVSKEGSFSTAREVTIVETEDKPAVNPEEEEKEMNPWLLDDPLVAPEKQNSPFVLKNADVCINQDVSSRSAVKPLDAMKVEKKMLPVGTNPLVAPEKLNSPFVLKNADVCINQDVSSRSAVKLPDAMKVEKKMLPVDMNPLVAPEKQNSPFVLENPDVCINQNASSRSAVQPSDYMKAETNILPVDTKTSKIQFRHPYPHPPPLPKSRTARMIIKENQLGIPEQFTQWSRASPAIEKLLLAARGDSLPRRSNACGALKVLCQQKKNQLALVRTEGFLDSIVFAVSAYIPNIDTEIALDARGRAVSTLLSVAEQKYNRKLVLVHPGVAECLLKVIEDDQGEARVQACAVIAVLAKTPANREYLANVNRLLDVLALVLLGAIDDEDHESSIEGEEKKEGCGEFESDADDADDEVTSAGGFASRSFSSAEDDVTNFDDRTHPDEHFDEHFDEQFDEHFDEHFDDENTCIRSDDENTCIRSDDENTCIRSDDENTCIRSDDEDTRFDEDSMSIGVSSSVSSIRPPSKGRPEQKSIRNQKDDLHEQFLKQARVNACAALMHLSKHCAISVSPVVGISVF